MPQAVTLSPALRSRFTMLAARTRLMRGARGAAIVLLTAALTAGLALAADCFFDLPSLVREGVFLLWAALNLTLLCKRLALPVLRPIDDVALAAAVEAAHPGFDERLTSVVQLAGIDDSRHGTREFIDLLVNETESTAAPVDFLAAVPRRATIVVSAAAAVALALLVAPAVAWRAEYGDLVHRFLLPWSDLQPYAFTVVPGDVTAARGSSVTIDVTVRPRSRRVQPPASATVVLTDADGHETTQKMRVDRADAFSFPLTVTGDGRYRVEARAAAGDTTAVSDSYQMTAVTPVELMPDSPAVTVTPPAYARATRDEETLTGLVDVTALQGSLIRFDLHFTRPAVAARLEWAASDTKTTDYPLVLRDDGRAADLSLPATASGSYRLVLEAEHGVETQLNGGTITVRPDQPPTVVKFAGREELKAVTPYDKLTLDCALADDIGVARADLEYRVNSAVPAREPFVLRGAGRPEATGQLWFALEGKVKDGDTLSYRLRVEDNLPNDFGGPHVVYAPADSWLSLKVTRQPGPVREEEIASQRDAVDRTIESIRQALLQEMRGLYKLKLESRIEPTLTPEQRDALGSLETENKTTEKALRDVPSAVPELQPLAQTARAIADKEMQQSEAALRAAGTARLAPAERDGHLKESDDRLGDALQKLDDLKKQNEQIAKDRADRLRFESLADKQQKLADKAAELAKKDPAETKELSEQLRREQAATAEELKRLTEQSPALKKALDDARAEQTRQAAERARALADQQRALNKAETDADTDRKNARLAEIAEEQRKLADKAARLAEETRPAARSARTQPLRANEAKRALDALKDGDTDEAARRQDQTARDLERLADALDRAIEQARDPREAARQLARLQDDIRQRVQDEMHRKNADRPLKDRLADLAREQDAVRKAAESLSVPPEDSQAVEHRRTASDKASRAADLLRDENPRPALGDMEQTRRALEELATRLPSREERERQALRDLANLRQQHDEIARQTEKVAREQRDTDSAKTPDEAKEKLADAAKRQDALADKVAKLDAPMQERRRDRARDALKQAAADMQKGLAEDASASQQKAARELERLEQALSGQQPADEKAKELAKRQQDLANDANRAATAAPAQKDAIRRKQQELARDAAALPAPEAPERRAQAASATKDAAQAADKDPTSPETRQKMEDAARKLEELARQMNGRESDAARAKRLASRQEQAATEDEKQQKQNPDKPPTPESQQRQEEIAREAAQVRAGEEGQAALRKARKALEDAANAPNPQERAAAQKRAAKALQELADDVAKNKDENSDQDPSTATPPAEAEARPHGLPTREQTEQARQLARKERDLRDAVRKANAEQPAAKRSSKPDVLGELAKMQAEVAKQSEALAHDLANGKGDQSAPARDGDKASQLTRRAADRLRDGDLKPARQAGREAADKLRQVAEQLAAAPRADGDSPDKEATARSRELAREQEEIVRRLDVLSKDPAARHKRQQARQQELHEKTGELEKDLKRLAHETNGNPHGGHSADEAAKAAHEAGQSMEQSDSEDASQAHQSREQAAGSLERAARQAEHSASEQSAGNDSRGQQTKASSEAGQSVRQAQGQMEQAQGQLGQGQNQGAKESMQNAARALQQAAGQMARGAQTPSSDSGEPANSPGAVGPAPGGRPDPSLFGPGISKYAGKTWGELPGELRSKIVQDMKAQYGEDYARMIKLYFEQLADTKRDGK
jgi:hypothetical protein